MSTNLSFTDGPVHAADSLARYRLDVLAASVEDAVQSAGGWLYDRVMGGWDVNVAVVSPCGTRPLQILGVTTDPVKLTARAVRNWPRTRALAVAGDVFAADAQVRDIVGTALDRSFIEVTLWGEGSAAQFSRHIDDVQHRLSTAAQAFKAHALSAAGLPTTSTTATENFRSRTRWYPIG